MVTPKAILETERGAGTIVAEGIALQRLSLVLRGDLDILRAKELL